MKSRVEIEFFHGKWTQSLGTQHKGEQVHYRNALTKFQMDTTTTI